MDDLLREYLDRAFTGNVKDHGTGPGPVVTLSRDFGCPSKLVAQLLVHELNRLESAGKGNTWRYFNKEVILEAARRLERNPADVDFHLNAAARGLIEDLVASFSGSYLSALRMRKTLEAVITSFSTKGYAVIVGRGGAGTLRGHPRALHVRLHAPMDWRAKDIAARHRITEEEARVLAEEIDGKRAALLDLMAGGKSGLHLFDLSVNCSTFSPEETVRMILSAMSLRKLA